MLDPAGCAQGKVGMLHGRRLRNGSGRVRPWRLAFVLLAILAGGAIGARAQDTTRRVLILYPDSYVNRSGLIAGDAIRRRFLQRGHADIKTYGEFLDLSQFSDDGYRQLMVRHLADKYAHTPLDAVVALGPDSLATVVGNRHLPAFKAPIVFCCVSSATLGGIDLPRDATGIVSEFDIARTVSLAERLQPDARRLVVIAGAAPFDQRWAQAARTRLAEHEKRLDTRYLIGLPRDALLAEVARLSRETIVVVLSIFRDGTGRDFVPVDIAEEIFNASKAPVYSPYDTVLGRGTVGGYMISFEAVGTETADLVLDVLGGRHASAPPLRASNAHAYRVDARQLARWSLSEKDLPAGAQVLFRQPTLWEEHRGAVLVTLGAFGAIATILGNLLLQMTRRRRAEASLKESEERMLFAVASTNTGLWQYDVPGKALWATQQCHALFGLEPGSPLGVETLLRRVHPDDRPVAIGAIRAASARAAMAERSEFRVVHPNGEVLWILASGKTHFDEEGKPVKVSGVFRDVTARKLAEHETEQLSRRLSTIQDEERQRIAEDLHDSTTQHLVAVGLNMSSLQQRVTTDAETGKLFSDIESSLEEATKELRTFTYLLNPPQLGKDGLRSTLGRYVDGFGRRTKLETRLKISPSAEKLPFSVQRALLRVVQEALANVHRHASASKVSVAVKCVAGRVHLVVNDDGKGAKGTAGREPCESFRAGVGIPGMTARLRRAGGDLEIHSGPGGTRLHGVMLANGRTQRAGKRARVKPVTRPSAM
jgi:PAS domain S-box-containing protein